MCFKSPVTRLRPRRERRERTSQCLLMLLSWSSGTCPSNIVVSWTRTQSSRGAASRVLCSVPDLGSAHTWVTKTKPWENLKEAQASLSSSAAAPGSISFCHSQFCFVPEVSRFPLSQGLAASCPGPGSNFCGAVGDSGNLPQSPDGLFDPSCTQVIGPGHEQQLDSCLAQLQLCRKDHSQGSLNNRLQTHMIRAPQNCLLSRPISFVDGHWCLPVPFRAFPLCLYSISSSYRQLPQ